MLRLRSTNGRVPSTALARGRQLLHARRPGHNPGRQARAQLLHDAARPRLPRAPTGTVTDAAAVSSETNAVAASDATQPFAWERNWWPVHVLSYLDASRPTPVELLGMQLVLWRDASGTWRCFRDSCPHRRVPLSEGRVEGGELVCSYHGWRFNEGGACTAIPQAPDAKSLAAATASPRSCVTSFPTQELGGLLWVWPEDSPAATANAAAALPLLPNAFYEPQFKEALEAGWFMRQMPYDYDILVENFVDPSHLPFAHHAVAPALNRKTAPPIPFTSIEDLLQPDDLDLVPSSTPPVCAFQFPTNVSKEHRVTFTAPVLITNHTKPLRTMTAIIVAPTGPGRSTVFTTSSTANQERAMPLMKALKGLATAIPKWLLHMIVNKLFDGDSVFLNAQGRFLRAAEQQESGEGPAWAKEYFMPMTSDRAVVAARKWIDTVGGGGPVYPPDAVPASQEARREQLLNRFEQHTKHCPDCQRGQQFASNLVMAGTSLLAAAFFAVCCLVGTYGFGALFAGALPSKAALAAATCCLVASWARSVGEAMQKQFTFVDYVHADIP